MNRVQCAGLIAGFAILAAIGALAQAAGPATVARAPEITGTSWINSAPLTIAGLRGRVVLIDFWTFG